MKACFTAVFPSLIRAESGVDRNSFVLIEDNSNSSGQSTPTKGNGSKADFLKPTLDKLLNLVQALLLQEPLQSTLDEIFTLLEPYLKLSEKLSREMSVTLLHATLRTFCQSHDLKKEEDDDSLSSKRKSFSPGPYIIGSLIPRCFDTSRRVQSTALACLQLLVRYMVSTMFENHCKKSHCKKHCVCFQFEFFAPKLTSKSTYLLTLGHSNIRNMRHFGGFSKTMKTMKIQSVSVSNSVP